MTTRTVVGNIRSLTDSAVATGTVTFEKLVTSTTGSTIHQSGVTTATTDASGDFSIALAVPASGSYRYRMILPNGASFYFSIASGASVNVATLIVAETIEDSDAIVEALAAYLPLSGGTLTGQLNFSGTTHAGIKLLPLTTAQRDALTPANGMVIYNSTTATGQVYQGGSWVSVGGGGASDVTDLTTTTGNVTEMLNVKAGGGLQYRTVAQVLADLRDSGALATPDLGVTVQGYSAKTAAIAALTWAANSIILLTSTTAASVQALAAHIVTLLQSASAADARTAIGAGTGNGDLLAANNLSEVTAATARTNLAVPGLAVANTFTAAQTINVASNVTQEIVKANATQTNDLVQWQNSSGTAISGIGGDGLEIYTRRFYALKNTSGTLKWTFVYNSAFDGFSFTESAVADFRLFLKAGGNVGFTNSNPQARLHPNLADAGTTTAPNLAILSHSSTGTPAAGFGAALAFQLETSTTDNTDAGRVAVLWNTATHASRVPDMVAYLTDSSAEREIWRGRATGSAPAIGFLGATPVARAAHIADAAGDDAATVNAILVVLENLGFIATS